MIKNYLNLIKSLLGNQDGYAETHYKFRFPWSPLSCPWPEIIVDAPCLAIQGAQVPFWIVIKDAHLYPIQVHQVTWTVLHQNSKVRTQGTIDVNQNFNEWFTSFPIEITVGQDEGDYIIDVKVEVENTRGKKRDILNWNYHGLPPNSLVVTRLKEAFPYPQGWFAGDLHCHTNISSDQVEFGGDLKTMTQAGQCVGLDFWAPTDHSYDFNYDSKDYMVPIDPQIKWNQLAKDIENLPPGLPTVIRSEEVSAGNHLNENVHFLVIGNEDYIPGHGDGGRRWFNNKPDLSIPQVQATRKSGVCFAAHPRVRVSVPEVKILNRGRWHEEDIHDGLDGLQFWNGGRGLNFKEGRAFWVKQLLKGNQLLPIAGNDAHGDLNRSSGVKIPLFSLWTSHIHSFGRVRTLFPAQSSSQDDLLEAMRGDISCITDGPFVKIENNSIQALSNSDWGQLTKVIIFKGHLDSQKETSELIKSTSFQWEQPFDMNDCDYIRVEVHTDKKCFALSSALFK